MVTHVVVRNMIDLLAHLPVETDRYREPNNTTDYSTFPTCLGVLKIDR